MLKKIGENWDLRNAETTIADAVFPMPFAAGLEYNAPARGPWNIVHTGMLIPESHQIFACAQGCLRGVILTAAEMNAMNRMSWIAVRENDIFDGSLEENVIQGTCDILNKMPEKPRAVLLFLSCIQLFAGCDFAMLLDELGKRFPAIDFIDCYMNPTMRKSGLTPDQLMRKQLYAPLRDSGSTDLRAVNLIGNDRATADSCEWCEWLRQAGFTLRDIVKCRRYDEYLQMAQSMLEVTYLPSAEVAGATLARRLNRRHVHLPLSYSAAEIQENYRRLGELLDLAVPDFAPVRNRAEQALARARKAIGGLPVEIDYTATPRPLGLARLLVEHGFTVTRVYADVFIPAEQADFEWLQAHVPDLRLTATVHAKMRFAGRGLRTVGPVLAVGQKAAYFSGTRHFVNMVAGGGWYGWDGIARFADALLDGAASEKNTETVIQHKGLGCESCL